MLKTLHLDKRILSDTECGECARQGWRWYEHVPIVVAAKPPHNVQQTLHIVRVLERPAMTNDSYPLQQLAKRLKGKTDSTGIDTCNE